MPKGGLHVAHLPPEVHDGAVFLLHDQVQLSFQHTLGLLLHLLPQRRRQPALRGNWRLLERHGPRSRQRSLLLLLLGKLEPLESSDGSAASLPAVLGLVAAGELIIGLALRLAYLVLRLADNLGFFLLQLTTGDFFSLPDLGFTAPLQVLLFSEPLAVSSQSFVCLSAKLQAALLPCQFILLIASTRRAAVGSAPAPLVVFSLLVLLLPQRLLERGEKYFLSFSNPAESKSASAASSSERLFESFLRRRDGP